MYSAWCAVMFESSSGKIKKKRKKTIPIEYINPLFFDYWRDDTSRGDKGRSFISNLYRKTLSYMDAEMGDGLQRRASLRMLFQEM